MSGRSEQFDWVEYAEEDLQALPRKIWAGCQDMLCILATPEISPLSMRRKMRLKLRRPFVVMHERF
jgi:hypothetical protein